MSHLTEENKSLIARLHDEVYNHHNLDAVDEIFDTRYENHTANIHGREKIKALYDRLLKEHPDTWVDPEDMVAEGDKVVTRWTWYNEGKPVTSGITIHRIENGKILEDWYSSRGV